MASPLRASVLDLDDLEAEQIDVRFSDGTQTIPRKAYVEMGDGDGFGPDLKVVFCNPEKAIRFATAIIDAACDLRELNRARSAA